MLHLLSRSFLSNARRLSVSVVHEFDVDLLVMNTATEARCLLRGSASSTSLISSLTTLQPRRESCQPQSPGAYTANNSYHRVELSANFDGMKIDTVVATQWCVGQRQDEFQSMSIFTNATVNAVVDTCNLPLRYRITGNTYVAQRCPSTSSELPSSV